MRKEASFSLRKRDNSAQRALLSPWVRTSAQRASLPPCVCVRRGAMRRIVPPCVCVRRGAMRRREPAFLPTNGERHEAQRALHSPIGRHLEVPSSREITSRDVGGRVNVVNVSYVPSLGPGSMINVIKLIFWHVQAWNINVIKLIIVAHPGAIQGDRPLCSLHPFHCWSLLIGVHICHLLLKPGHIQGVELTSHHHPFHCWT